MATPIIEYIAENLKNSIAAITTANGFNQNLNACRPTRKDIQTSWEDLDAIITMADAEPLAAGNSTVRWKQYFLVTVFCRDSDTDTNAIDTRRNKIRADVEKKLTEDLTRGGYAQDTNFHESAFWDEDEGGLGGVGLIVSVDYSTKINDPYTKR
ncbi:MAG: hypothetical protein JXA04_01325 [Gammaproteobacteria bacterium]|nr:hypothetical protein [Gammaproteobacteria bacterium]